MPWKKRKTAARRSYAKRKPSKRRYNKKRKAVKRRGTSATTRAVNRTGWTAIPYQVKTVRSFDKYCRVRYSETFLCTPIIDTTNQNGYFQFRIRADCPMDVLNFTSAYNVGQAHVYSGNTLGQNSQLVNLMTNYNAGYVIGSKLEITAMPTHYTAVYSETEPAYQAAFNNQAMLWGMPDNTPNPYTTGTQVADCTNPQIIMGSRNTVVRYTEAASGTESRGAAMTLYYSPKKVYAVKDMADQSEDFLWLNNGYNTPSQFPVKTGYFNFGLASASPIPSTWSAASPGVTTTVPGIPRPHVVTVKATYYCRFFSPFAGTPNIPPS
jgi:hypothetical protein